ncbi:MAG: acyl--CoA ligase [Anaerolineaceae bacterium]|nr:acyl--CoA ligase [Anaerolineaceae bacterium]
MKLDETLYNNYIIAQKDNRLKVALYTRDNEVITHNRLIEEVDKTAAGLLSYKTNSNFKIGIISSSSYEEAVFLLAASKIGAVSKFIDFTKNITEICESITESSISVLVMGAEFLPMEQFINPANLPVIVLGNMPINRQNCCSYQDFLNNVVENSLPAAQYKKDSCAVIINSSGTTGTPKPIELSDYALNSAVEKISKTDYPLNNNNLILKIVPSHIGMGLITTLYTGLIIGIPVIYLGGNSPTETIDLFVKFINEYDLFLKNKQLSPDTKLLIFGSPLFFRAMLQLVDHIQDFSFIACMLAGGSAMSKEELEIMDTTFGSKGCTVPVLNGYGQNEMAGAVTLNQIHLNRRGSAGTPVVGTDILIVDISSGKPLQRNKAGLILERSESLFSMYENMEEETRKSFILSEQGEKWFNTHDIGYLDDDGFLFITGRTSRIIIRFDVKVSLDKIESKIRESKYVKEVGVIAINDVPYDSPLAFVTFNDEYITENILPEKILDDIQTGPNPLNELEMVKSVLIVNSIPYRSAGKIDYRALEKMAEEATQ